MSNNTADILQGVAEGASLLSAVPGPVGIVGKIAAIVFSSAAAFAGAGRDPVAEIKRIHSSDPIVRNVHEEWKRRLDRRFGSDDNG